MQTTALIWTGAGTAGDPRRPLLPDPPPGHYLAGSSVDVAAGIVHYQFAELPPPPPEPEPDPEPPAE